MAIAQTHHVCITKGVMKSIKERNEVPNGVRCSRLGGGGVGGLRCITAGSVEDVGYDGRYQTDRQIDVLVSLHNKERR